MEVGRRGRNVWVGILLLGAGVPATGCASSTSGWWGSAATEHPCGLDLGRAVARETGAEVIEVDERPGDYETVCTYRLDGSTIGARYFDARDPDLAAALESGDVWTTDGVVGDASGWQDASGTIYYRAVEAGGGVQVSVATTDGSPALDLARTSARLGLELLGELR